MIKLNSHKDSLIQFDVDVKNVGDGNLKGYLRLVHESIEYGFPVDIQGRRAKVTIPALTKVIPGLTNKSLIEAKMEFYGGSDYVQAWADTVEAHVPPKVDVKIAAKEKLDVSIDNTITIEEDKAVAPVAKVSKTKDDGITEKTTVRGNAPTIKVETIEIPDHVWAAVKPRPKRVLSEEEQAAQSKKIILERCSSKKSMKKNEEIEMKTFGSFFAEASTKVETTDPDKGDSHWHTGTVDDEGDGKTTKTFRVAVKGAKPDKHQHNIVGAEVQSANGHIHFLKG